MNRSLLLAVTLVTIALDAPARAQHLDVLAQVVNGKLVTGAADYDANTWLVGQQVFKRQLLSNFRSNAPGFTALQSGDPLLEPGVLGLAGDTNLFLDIVPTTIDGQRANFWWWDGADTDPLGFDTDDVGFGPAPAGVTWNIFNIDFDLFTADGSDTTVPGVLIQQAFSDGDVHSHLVMQVADSDGNSQTTPPEGVYLAAMVLRADGYEDSDPFFFVHRTSGLTNEPRDAAAAWVEANYDRLTNAPGDYNFDGVVDAADYTVWRDGLGVDFENADYDVWRDNYGAGAAVSAAVSVPTPTGVALLVTLILPAIATRRV